MGTATRIYGCIEEYGIQGGEMQSKIYAHNEKVIEQLPQNDEWPPLSRNMFAITDNSEFEKGKGINFAYTGRIIHFGANFKSFEQDWKIWKLKFEQLLTRLIWLSADVHFKVEYTGIQTFTWRVDLKKWSLYDKSQIEPVKEEYWDFVGDRSWENFK